MTEVAALAERVNHLIDRVGEMRTDAKESGDKLHEIEKSISFVRGAVWVFGGFYALALVIISAVLAWKFGS